MSRSREPGLLEVVARAPWWVGVLFAAASYLGLGVIGQAWAQASPLTRGLAPVFAMLGNLAAVMFLGAALVAFIRRRRRAALLDAQADLASIRALDWRRFEALVAESYARQGWRVEHTGRAGPDGGVDLRLRRAGETVLVQCKHWRATRVGVGPVRELFGVMTAEGASRAALVCSGTFTAEARSFATGKPIELVDGAALARLVADVRKAAPTAPVAVVTDTAEPGIKAAVVCPKCAAAMVLRTAQRGPTAGSTFWGCTRFPACRGVRPADA